MIRPTNIGICGAHRTGKTTLAETIAERSGIPFLRTSTSEITCNAGVDPTLPMDFTTHLQSQYAALEAYEELFRAFPSDFISDSTPFDLMACTLGEISGSTEVDFDMLKLYVDRCFELSNSVFGTVVAIQPGIPLVNVEGKAVVTPAYIEHLNTLILGLCYDARNKASILVLNRALTTLDGRARMIIHNWVWVSTLSPQVSLRA